MLSRIILLVFLLCVTFIQVHGAKVGDKCIISQTALTGTCRRMSDCLPAKLDFDLDGIEPTYCNLDFFDINHVFVCCQDLPELETTSQSPVQTTKAPVVEDVKKRISQKKCEEYNRNATEFVEHVSFDISTDPLSGSEAQLGEFPHMAGIGYIKENQTEIKFLCAAVLISPKFLIGAAHCHVKRATLTPVLIRLGVLDLESNITDNVTPVNIQIKNVYVNPDYKAPKKYNDIALIELTKEVPISDLIRPTCLWQEEGSGGFEQVVLSSWNAIHPNFKIKNKRLKKVVLYLYNTELCNQKLKNYRNRNWLGIEPSQICAGDERDARNSCQGDSGAPIQVKICNEKCLNYVMGFTSFGLNCQIVGLPSIYTRTSFYLDWIESIVWPEGS